jgi:hypothetical protein
MRRLLLSLALALALSAVGASSAVAGAPEGAQKAPLYGPKAESAFSCEAGVFPTPETFGFVILNTPGNETTVRGEVVLKHAAPDTTYAVVFVEQAEGSLCAATNTVSTAFTTNQRGNANLHFKVPRDATATKFWVGIGLEPGETFGSPAVELD